MHNFKTKARSLVEAIYNHSVENPDNKAVADSLLILTYKDFWDRIYDCAKKLRQIGLIKNQRVFVEAHPQVEYIVTYFAIQLLHCTAIPYSCKLSKDTIAHMANVSDAKFSISKKGTVLPITNILYEDIRKEIPSEEALDYSFPETDFLTDIFFTSGTTGKSKGVGLTTLSILGGAVNTINGCQKQQTDIELVTPPLYHSQAFSTIRALFVVGGCVVLNNTYFTIETLQNLLNKYHCNCLNTVPATLKLLVNDLGDNIKCVLKNLRYIEIGAAPLDKRTKIFLLNALPNTRLALNYGATEASRTVYNNLTSIDGPLDALGKIVENVECKIIDEDGKDLTKTGKPGRLIFKGDMVMKGYVKNNAETDKVLKNGWYYSSDLAYLSKLDGCVYILGRVDDVINIGGEKICPAEIEQSILTIPQIDNCCCVGVDDFMGILGQIPVVFYSSKSDISVVKLKQSLKDSLDRVKRPKIFIRLEKIPTNSILKNDRNALKRLWKNEFESKYRDHYLLNLN